MRAGLIIAAVILMGPFSAAAQTPGPQACPAETVRRGPPAHPPVPAAQLTPPPLAVTPDASPALDDLLMRARTAMGALTLTAAVADDNGVWSGRQGEGAHPLHWWASAGKMATAIAVLQMVEEDRVSLDDPVSRWIEGVPLGDRITVRMLLDHTSGLFSANEAPPVRAAPRYRTLPELVEVARAEGSLFCPGESWRYSNTNYWLLGGIIETVDGVPLAEALDRRVIQRAGLRDIRILSPTDTLADVAPAGPPNIEAGEIAANPAWVGAAGPLVATPEAMIGLLHALLSGRLLKPETVQTQLAEAWPMFGQPQFYGLGLMAYEPPDRAGALWVGHSGGAPGARAIVVWSPTDQAFAAVALTGAGSPEAVANRLLQLRAASR